MDSSIKSSTKDNLPANDIFDVNRSNCLKGVAIILLLVHHCFLSPDRYKGQTLKLFLPEAYLTYFASFSKICVSIFVFISAYGLTKKMMTMKETKGHSFNVSVSNLISSRLVKLLGSFMLVFLLIDLACVFLSPGRIGKFYGTVFPDNVEYFVTDMLGLAHLLGTPSFRGTYWYYGLAIFIILAVPFLFLLLKRFESTLFLILMVTVDFTVSFQNRNIWHYLLCIGVGMVCAYNNTVTRWVEYSFGENKTFSHIVKFVLEVVALAVLMILRQGPLMGELYSVWDAVIPFMMVIFCCEFLFRVPVLREILKVLGIYSANIFLVHNFIRATWFYDFTYSFQYPALIILVLLLDSLAVSVAIELLKKGIRFNQLLNRIIWIFHRE